MTANTELDVEQQDEYFLDTPAIRDFVAAVEQVIAEQDAVEARLTALQPRFAELLSGNQSWLTEEFAAPNPQSGHGRRYRHLALVPGGDKSLSLFSLVVPSCSETPVHDHLAWGFVGLYRGEQARNGLPAYR